MKITKHIPTFCDVESKVAEFSTVEELVAIGFVKSFAKYKGFTGYALSREYLIATYGNEQWVVGHLSNPEKVDLPVWEKGKPGKIL